MDEITVRAILTLAGVVLGIYGHCIYVAKKKKSEEGIKDKEALNAYKLAYGSLVVLSLKIIKELDKRRDLKNGDFVVGDFNFQFIRGEGFSSRNVDIKLLSHSPILVENSSVLFTNISKKYGIDRARLYNLACEDKDADSCFHFNTFLSIEAERYYSDIEGVKMPFVRMKFA